MPGSEKDQLRRAMQLADRVSINLEAANPVRLAALAPRKKFAEELLAPLKWAEEIRQKEAPRTWNGRWASTITQFVVGASGESDLELLSTSEYLYKQLKLKRTYFSAFVPIEDTPLENHPAENPWREHRLYQASFLLRDYGFSMEELPFAQTGQLPLNKDPKTAWAEQTLLHQPIELNKATRRRRHHPQCPAYPQAQVPRRFTKAGHSRQARRPLRAAGRQVARLSVAFNGTCRTTSRS
jgi:predicted DNA-binding helix-hairpin-helix protein